MQKYSYVTQQTCGIYQVAYTVITADHTHTHTHTHTSMMPGQMMSLDIMATFIQNESQRDWETVSGIWLTKPIS